MQCCLGTMKKLTKDIRVLESSKILELNFRRGNPLFYIHFSLYISTFDIVFNNQPQRRFKMKTIILMVSLMIVSTVSAASAANTPNVWRIWQTYNPKFSMEQFHREIKYLFPGENNISLYVNKKEVPYKSNMNFDGNTNVGAILKEAYPVSELSPDEVQSYQLAYEAGNWYSTKEEALDAVKKLHPNENISDEDILKKYKFYGGDLRMLRLIPFNSVEETPPFKEKLVDWMKQNVLILCSICAVLAVSGTVKYSLAEVKLEK